MPLYLQTVILFTLNFLDAVLTVFWIRNGYATEGNTLMATLLELGEGPFLAVKIFVGALAALVLWNWRHMKLAKHGLILSLVIYGALMVVHFVTGLSALGLILE